MAKKRFTRAEVIAALELAMGEARQSDFARGNNLTRQEVSMALNGSRPSGAILKFLGMRRVKEELYERAK